MIHVDRGHEPPALAAKRTAGLARLREIACDSACTLRSEDFEGYDVAAEPLYEAQGRKCCYCERAVARSYNDTEHFRPKARADRGAGFVSEHGYWWLAWTWDNLLFACPICNRTYKRSRFPLQEGSRPLQPEEQPPGAEKPLLIDPGGEDPLDSITFVPVKVKRKTQWVPIGKHVRGEKTIGVLGLGREALVEQYTTYVAHTIEDKIATFREVLASQDGRAIQGAWARMVRPLLRKSAPFAALAHDVIAHRIPADVRQRWRLELLRPPIDG